MQRKELEVHGYDYDYEFSYVSDPAGNIGHFIC